MNKLSSSSVIKPSDILQTLINSEEIKINFLSSYIGAFKAIREFIRDIAIGAYGLIVGHYFRCLHLQAVDYYLIRAYLTNKSRN